MLQHLVLFTLVCCSSILALAEKNNSDLNNQIWALKFASRISQIQNVKNLNIAFSLNERDQKMADAKWSKLVTQNMPNPKVRMGTQPSDVELTFGKQVFHLSFRDFHHKVIWVQSIKVVLDEHKTFLNYWGELNDLSPRQSKKSALSNLFLNLAIANPASYLADLARFVFSDFLVSNDMRQYAKKGLNGIHNLFLGDNLSRVYQVEIDDWNANRGTRKKEDRFRTLIFSCKQNKLDFVRYCALNQEAQCEKPSAVLAAEADGNYNMQTSCANWSFNSNGNVVATNSSGQPQRQRIEGMDDSAECNSRSFTNQTNLFQAPPFFQFPLIAATCCQTEGCYEKVSATLSRLRPTMKPEGTPARATQ